MARLLLLLLFVSPAFAQEAVSGAVSDSRQPRHLFNKCRKHGNCGFQGGQGFQGGYGGYQGGYGGNNGGYPGSPINIAISQSQSAANGAEGGHNNGYYPNNYQYNGGYPGYNHGYNQGYNRPGYFGNGQGSYNNQFNGNYYGPQGGYGGHQGGFGGPQGGYGGYGFQRPIFDEASGNGPQNDDDHVNDQVNNLQGSDYDEGSYSGASTFSYAGRSNH